MVISSIITNLLNCSSLEMNYFFSPQNSVELDFNHKWRCFFSKSVVGFSLKVAVFILSLYLYMNNMVLAEDLIQSDL